MGPWRKTERKRVIERVLHTGILDPRVASRWLITSFILHGPRGSHDLGAKPWEA
jgi:hypothetical protein